MKSKISCWRFVRLRSTIEASLLELAGGGSNEHVFGTIARPADGLKAGAGGPRRPRRAGLYSLPRACGGTGRRARLRALWTIWSVEVRILSGALESPADAGFFLWPVPGPRGAVR